MQPSIRISRGIPRFMLIERRVIKSFLLSCAEARREGRTFELGMKE
ncbi:hypothetical protein GCWU000341_02239 [Oribacterium sp. oral taxon 078 str. F0262]|nr:hypothetical protein GCWU000341_02239 [Oribacterium sp. oral taxon 078 str. F0262]